ncbi:hypothetical protein [Cytobacillus sp. IB215316]|uniref:ArsR/SmtB family transcription factor n=1 Tax=Cytobacillus sp. IB215316 TaxID=3097354 RepID=UPI002A0D9ABD|nr:hypothetical protein [Cytobacillus sp. IB215316]MDX8360710.1 hypothetical protein [Cytobacillus sp. IB215316]
MNNYQNLINTIKALQDPIRIKIIEILHSEYERREFLSDKSEALNGFCPMDIAKILKEEGFNVSNTKLSYHLKELKENNLIYLARDGKRLFYVLKAEGFEILANWLENINVPPSVSNP